LRFSTLSLSLPTERNGISCSGRECSLREFNTTMTSVVTQKHE
jgi:hypothetical protein